VTGGLAFAGRPVGQVGIVVRDLDASLERYSRVWELGPWRCWTYGPRTVPELSFRGARGDYEMRIALCGSGPQMELIEPLRGPSIYHEWLAEHGEGLHHLGIYVPSFDEGLAAMAKDGYEPVQLGRGYGAGGDGGYAYFDLRPVLGVYLELIEVPRERIPPERVFPEP
jgi:methylmalonyl-CoA/ethylmalonyl-CoA epimerase